MGIDPRNRPAVKISESHQGSWIVEAALVTFSSVGTAYTLLKGISELPKIADGLIELKDRIRNDFKKRVAEEAELKLKDQVDRFRLENPPEDLIAVDFTIDARPLVSLQPAVMISHSLNLRVAVSREGVSIENMGDKTIRNISLGLFAGEEQSHNWSFRDAYQGRIDLLTSNQTIMKDIAGFKNQTGDTLILDDHPKHVDCWIQDQFGIYLFMFYLEN